MGILPNEPVSHQMVPGQRPIQFGGVALPALHHRYRSFDDLREGMQPTYWGSQQDRTSDLPGRITQERVRALDKHGVNHHDPDRWLAIITEELGEFATEINDLHEAVEGDAENRNALIRNRYSNMLAELAQTAAMCIHALCDLEGFETDRQSARPLPEVVFGADPKRWWEPGNG